MPEIIYTKVKGVLKRNRDGKDRQALIETYLDEGDELFLHPEINNPFSQYAIAVFTKSGDQLGYLNDKISAPLVSLINKGGLVLCKIKNITGGKDEKYYGVNIEIEKYSPEEALKLPDEVRADKNKPIRYAPRPSDKDYITTLLLCFFLGWVGAHRWYVGRGSWWYTLTFGWLLIGWVIDLFVIALGLFKDNKGHFIKFK